MSTPEAGKSRLFLLELIFMIFFLAAAGAVCVQIFVKAHTLSRDSAQLTAAVNLAQSTVSVLEAGDFSADSLKNQWPEGTEQDSQYFLYLDEEWNNCSAENGTYLLTVEFTSHSLKEAHISVLDKTGQDSIYTLDVSHYEEAAYEK